SLDSINATTSAIVRYVSQRAGIGINAGRIRALGSPIRGGEAQHTGCIPFYKLFQTAVKCCSQGGVRGGAATLFYPLWHLEVESLLVLKNNRGVEDNRVRHMDYGVQLNKTMYTRLIKGQDISLFSPSDTPGLYDAFFEDQDKFEALYTKYENDPNIRSRQIPAADLFSLMMQERASTGRIYIQNVDHCNTHSPFDATVAPIRQSNLCMEIALPTKPLDNINDEEGEIALCTLSAVNLGKV
ncbi:MAG TPA: ribonucleotide-diphosphate reductase subunit alpha, partial [Psychrobacter sp.]|nr:ribonucleotide-diphosphate reductase subunit alpha [Psychrobacter sp.]